MSVAILSEVSGDHSCTFSLILPVPLYYYGLSCFALLPATQTADLLAYVESQCVCAVFPYGKSIFSLSKPLLSCFHPLPLKREQNFESI